MKKRILSMMMAIVMVVGLLPVMTPKAEASFISQGYESDWKKTYSGTVEFSQLQRGDVLVPGTTITWPGGTKMSITYEMVGGGERHI